MLGGLSACGPAEEVPPAKPELVWIGGPPDGPLESNEWVRVVREAEFAYAWASNAADFSLPALTSTWDDFAVRSLEAAVRGDLLHETPHVYLGPRPVAPVAVQVDEDHGGAVVAACVGAPQAHPPRDDGNRWPDVEFYLLELADDGGRFVTGGHTPTLPFVLPNGAELTPEYCDGVPIPRATFDPPPDLDALSAKGPDGVVPPASSDPSAAS
ncbi:hypothetical protein [Cellulomonas xiejunii]|uniref:Lipoprotein n=1 Tax=Cellulomonas xiejunii TaxID=2968083 RepID=A0ABY5KQN2_9CELL|nr:hypothetical protein [Cellulomonas xiejunii]UUI71497.1 hypothetical protein NP048_17155 [Cellulomonas xiejunii]